MSQSSVSSVSQATRLVDAVVPVAVADRSGRVESVHHGVTVALAADGSLAAAFGDPEVSIYPRSCNKPFQADAMLRCGLRLEPDALALACASHAGTPRHLAIVERILAGAGLGVGDLANTADLPIDRDAADALLAAGGRRDSLHQTCSGKHAAMLATCVVAGWPTEGYLDVDHPLQRAITTRIAELTGARPLSMSVAVGSDAVPPAPASNDDDRAGRDESSHDGAEPDHPVVAHIGVDGCGAPAHVVPLVGLARAMATIARQRGPIWSAMRAHPDLVGGDGRDATRLMRAVPDLIAKDGAEGVFVAALPDGRAAAVKIADGNARAAGVVLAATLGMIGVDVTDGTVGDPVLGHGRPVGRVRSIVGI